MDRNNQFGAGGAEAQDRLLDLCVQLELGLIGEAEREEISELLDVRDPDALQALAEARDTLGAVAGAAEAQNPPPEIKQRLFDRIAEPAPRTAAASAPAGIRMPRWAALGWAAAAALIAFVYVSDQRNDDLQKALEVIEQRQAALEQTNDRYRKLFDILAAPGTRSVSLEAADRADIRAFWNDQSGLALTAEGLAAPERGRAFQLWAIPKEGAPVSIDIFRPLADETALIFAEPAIASAEAQALAITEEDAAGAEQPTSNPIWVGPLR